MSTTKRRGTAILMALVLGGGAGLVTNALSPQPAQATEETTYGHQHDEPDGSVFCHCGTGKCYPCGGGANAS